MDSDSSVPRKGCELNDVPLRGTFITEERRTAERASNHLTRVLNINSSCCGCFTARRESNYPRGVMRLQLLANQSHRAYRDRHENFTATDHDPDRQHFPRPRTVHRRSLLSTADSRIFFPSNSFLGVHQVKRGPRFFGERDGPGEYGVTLSQRRYLFRAILPRGHQG